jgi:universal stress protein A
MSIAFRKILVATDFSPVAAIALECGRTLARRFGAEMYVIHVIEEPFMVGAEFYPPEVASFRTRLVDHARRELGRIASELDDVRASTEVIVGPVARRILESASEQRADLIVMGTHGRGAVARFLIGSVAERVVRAAECPVLTVHDVAASASEERQRLAS